MSSRCTADFFSVAGDFFLLPPISTLLIISLNVERHKWREITCHERELIPTEMRRLFAATGAGQIRAIRKRLARRHYTASGLLSPAYCRTVVGRLHVCVSNTMCPNEVPSIFYHVLCTASAHHYGTQYCHHSTAYRNDETYIRFYHYRFLELAITLDRLLTSPCKVV